MVENNQENTIDEFIENQIPIIDELLAKQQTPLQERPFAAAHFFAEHCVINVKGGSKDNYLEQFWFKAIYKLIKKWYEDRYAEAMQISSNTNARGIVLVHDTPFELQIPLSISEELENNSKMWFSWPNDVLKSENVLEWFVNAPNFERIHENELASIKNIASQIGAATRSIRINIMTAGFGQSECKLARSIPTHINKAVGDILSLESSRISLSIWELHLALEKSLKLIIKQKGREAKNTHDLRKLCNTINNNIAGIVVETSQIEQMPSHHEAIRHRYGEADPVLIQQVVANYQNGLKIILSLTEILERKMRMNNARIQIQLPPWER